jgi:hypothetical protein
MGAAMLEGLIDADTTFTFCFLLDADGNESPPTVKSVWEIFNLVRSMTKRYAYACLQDQKACPRAISQAWCKKSPRTLQHLLHARALRYNGGSGIADVLKWTFTT